MDIISHGLWTTVAAKLIHKKNSIKRLSSRLLIFFGILPDAFSFTPLIIWSIYNFFSGHSSVPSVRPDNIDPIAQSHLPVFYLTNTLYNISHSMVIFFLLFAIAYLIFKGPQYGMLGWVFHILVDIPTHTFHLYPTPFLWPLSEWRFDGISWEKSGFLITNYLIIAVAFLLINKIKPRLVITEPVENDEAGDQESED